MQKIPLEKALSFVFYTLLMAGIGVIGYVGMSRRAESPALQAALGESTEMPDVIALTNCAESMEKLCILSTGYDAEGNLLVSLKVGLRPIPQVYARLVDGRLNIRFECRVVDISPRLLYCLGPFSGDADFATLEIYTVESDSLIASGPLVPGEMAQVPEPPLVELPPELTSTKPADVASYPEDSTSSYPSYPSYPTYP